MSQPDPRAAASRRSIATSAHQLFVSEGYVATTIGRISAEADVAVQTIYNTVGNKAAVLNLVLESVAAGENDPGTVRDFMEARVSAATTLDDVVDVLADWFSEVHPRTADLFRIIRDASAVDSEVAELRRRRERIRFENYHHAADALAKHGHSVRRPVEDVAAAIWSFAHPETYAFLTTTANWDLPRYRAWIRDQLSALG